MTPQQAFQTLPFADPHDLIPYQGRHRLGRRRHNSTVRLKVQSRVISRRLVTYGPAHVRTQP